MKTVFVIRKRVVAKKIWYYNQRTRSRISATSILNLKWPIVIIDEKGKDITQPEIFCLTQDEIMQELS